MNTAQKVVLGAVGAFAAFLVFGAIAGRPEYDGGISKTSARDKCEQMIKGLSVNPASVQIGRVDGERIGELISFKWGPADLQMQNRTGGMLGTSAVCRVNLKNGSTEEFKVF